MGSIKAALIAIAVAGPALLGSGGEALAHTSGVEPKAGTWRTWVLSSGRELRLPPPPDAIPTRPELAEVQGSGAEEAVVLRAQQATAVEGRGQGGGLPKGLGHSRPHSPLGPDRPRTGGTTHDRQTHLGSRPLTGTRPSRIRPAEHRAPTMRHVAAWDSKYDHHRPRRPWPIRRLGRPSLCPNRRTRVSMPWRQERPRRSWPISGRLRRRGLPSLPKTPPGRACRPASSTPATSARDSRWVARWPRA
jgi:hypothetical protein